MQADTQTADPEAEVTEEAKGSSEKSEGSESPGGSESEGGAAAAEPAEATAKDDVEIPQQQTAEKAADNEAGENART
ncbi:gliding motility protein [Streptomyces mirabilis]|uniref:gliding motility protein n=1 Tax=Streptomyces mirabilis TaxID=68239 RepID=UPI0034E95D56